MKKTLLSLVALSTFVAAPAYADNNNNYNNNNNSANNPSTLSLETLTSINTITEINSTSVMDINAGSYTGNFNGLVLGDGALTGSTSGSAVASLADCGCTDLTVNSQSVVEGKLNGPGMISAGVSGSALTQVGTVTTITDTTSTTTTTTSQVSGL